MRGSGMECCCNFQMSSYYLSIVQIRDYRMRELLQNGREDRDRQTDCRKKD